MVTCPKCEGPTSAGPVVRFTDDTTGASCLAPEYYCQGGCEVYSPYEDKDVGLMFVVVAAGRKIVVTPAASDCA